MKVPFSDIRYVRYISWWAAASFLVLYLLVPSLGVQGASSVAQGFQSSSGDIASGALVSLEADTPNTVELSNTGNADRLLGVVGEQALIELSDDDTAVRVVTSGVAHTLVSDINGDVQTGDHIAVSPIEGVGMRASTSAVAVGTAQASLDSVDTHEQVVTDRDGDEQAVQIGLVPVQVNIVFFPGPQDGSPFVPAAMQNLANAVAGHQVSPVRVVIASLIMLLMFVSVVVLLYSATRSSIISIGRNPLSGQAVHKSLFEVGLTIIGMLAFTVILIYLILTL